MVSRRVEGDIHRTTYRELAARARRMANALARLRRADAATASRRWPGTATATSSSTTPSRARARCCTRSTRGCIRTRSSTSPTTPRTRSLFFDLTFLPLVEAIARASRRSRHFVAMTDRAHMPADSKIPNLLCYEELLDARERRTSTGRASTRTTASSLCYTSGTTGNPKGVLYSHRSTVLHTFAIALPDALNCSARDAILPVVPMFHVNAWGLPYAACMIGREARLPRPGARRQVALRAVRERAGDAVGRRADRLAGPARATSRRTASSSRRCGAPSSAARPARRR